MQRVRGAARGGALHLVTTDRYDAVIVGGGHNGLVSAFYLARAGLRVCVLERRELVGGACTTEEFAPGFKASPGAYVLSMLRPAIWSDLRLRERGLVVDAATPSLNLYPDGSHLFLHGDAAEASEEIARFSKRDARRYPAFEERLATLAEAILPVFDRTPPDPRALRMRELPDLAWFARLGMRNRKLLGELSFLFTTSIAQYLDGWFESDELKSALGWEGISNTLSGSKAFGTAYVLLHDHASGVGQQNWGFVRGGMGEVTRLLAEAATEHGALIRTDAEVERILVRGGRATGVVLAGSGEEIGSDLVISNADPKRTLLGLVGERELPHEVVGAIRAYRTEGASMKINLGVDELPRLAGFEGADTAGSQQPYHRALVQLTKPLGDLDLDQAQARAGRPAPEPHVELCVPSVLDPSLAPEGSHVVTIGVRSQPYTLAEGTWDERKEAIADDVIARVGGSFPNLPRSVRHREVLSPLDLERRLSLTGGHHMHGDMSPDQLLFLRPIRGYGSYRSPIDGLYLCGAGTHPGGGVTGANGRNCAARVLRDGRRSRGVRV
ncbi:MAG: NAD(P)/FAD-dependent oxidoreductase [Actinomycetota bacterium]